MNESQEPLVGSAEPLTPEQTEARLRELEEWGVDLSLVQTALARTPAQRLLFLQDRLALIKEMQQAWEEQYATPRRHLNKKIAGDQSSL